MEGHVSSLLTGLDLTMDTAPQTLVHVHHTKCNAILTGTYLIKNYLVFIQYESIMFNLYVKNMKAVAKIGK